MNAAKVKSLLPLFGGVALLVLAVAGGALSFLNESEGSAEGADTRVAAPRTMPVPLPAAAIRKAPESVPALSAEEIEVRDREEIGRIILAQIAQTPEEIDTTWLADVCRYVSSPSILEELVLKALEQGERFDAQYLAEQAANNISVTSDPRFFINQGREMLYGAEPSARRLEMRVPGLLAMGLFREYQRAEGDWEAVRDNIRISYFKESLQLTKTLGKLAAERGEADPQALREDVVQLLEAAIFDHFLRIERYTRYARKDLKESNASGKPVTILIGQWRNSLASHLLDLGKTHLETAKAENLYKRKQQKHAEQAFKILAMVYKLTDSGEAMLQILESNRIQRYNIWKMGQAAWTRARQAVASGDSALAEREYFLAKRRYLQCLSRLEGSKRESVNVEYRRLQQDIFQWKRGKAGAQVSEGAEGS